jgi:hypothetical protein
VPLLDFGQGGGARQSAGTALFTGRIVPGVDEVLSVEHRIPQQYAVFRDVLGYGGGRFTLEGIIRAKTDALALDVVEEINQRLHGSMRDQGGLTSFAEAALRETQLTDHDGSVLGNKVVMTAWSPRGARMRNSEWAMIVAVRMEFLSLG